jgi:predicted O-methyltransferase YrrM
MSMSVRLRRRILRPVGASPKRASIPPALAVALLVTGAVVVPNRPIEGVLAGAAGGTVIWLLSWRSLETGNKLEREAQSLWGLSGLMSEGRFWPIPGGWALSAEAIAVLSKEARRRDLKVVVELGPGTSSIVLGRGLTGQLKMFGVEHHPDYAAFLRRELEAHEILDYTLVESPLTEQQIEGRTVSWYDPACLGRLPESIDVLLIDGPPNERGDGARAPAWPLLRSRMREGGLVLVDDTDRADERAMVDRWVRTGELRVLADHGEFVLLEVQSSRIAE